MGQSTHQDYDRDLEADLLGAMLVNRIAVETAAEAGLPDDAFFDKAHRAIYDAVRSLYSRGDPVNASSVIQELRRTPDALDSIGGPQRVLEVLAAAGPPSAAAYNARQLANYAAARRCRAAARLILEKPAGTAEDDFTGWADDLWREAIGGGTGAKRHPVLVRVSDVQAERVEWLWAGRIPAGKITVLDGDPGLGKSTVTLDLAARVTTGSPMPDGSPLPGPAGVVLLSAEDGVADTIRPRLEAAGADLTRVAVLEAVTTEGGIDRPPSLPLDLAQLEQAVVDMSAGLVVIDPLMAYLGGGTNSFRDQDVRAALHPLKQMAERTGCTILLVRHLNKATGPSAVYRGGGSIGIIGAARAGLLVAPDPKDENRRIVAPTKSNLGPPVPAMAYRLIQHELGCAAVAWDGTTEHTADDLLRVEDEDERTERDEAADALRRLLCTGPRPAKEVEREMTRAGFSKATTRRAKKAAGIETKKSSMEGGWHWHLPSEGAHQPPEGAEGVHPQEVSTFDTFGDTFGTNGHRPPVTTPSP